jgi:hypothetical protein
MRFRLLPLALLTPVAQASPWDWNEPAEWVDLSAHFHVVGGVTTGDFEALATHGHDPNQDLVLQGAEVGASLRFSDVVQGFVNANMFQTLDDDLDAEWEEGFVKFAELPGGFELRGGRYLNRFGTQNNVHLHGWDFVDANLVTTQFLGEEGLVTEGGEVTWILGDLPFLSAFSLSFGNAAEHSHDHGHGAGEHEHEEEDEEHEEEEEHDHGHAGEQAFFTDSIVTGRWMGRWTPNDFHQHQAGLNAGFGRNGYGRDTCVYSGDYFYTWRENGLEPGGRWVRAGGEVFYRDVEWFDDVDRSFGDAGQWGAVVSGIFGFASNWEAAARIGWFEGVESGPAPGDVVFGAEERIRYTAAVTRRFNVADDWSGLARLQYNFDDLDGGGTDHSVFLQFGIDWGQGEVR